MCYEGYKHTDETKQKIREAHIGKQYTQEYKDKMSDSLKGRVFTEEHKKKISLALLGKKKSPEAVAKSSNSKRGKHTSLFGRKRSEEFCKKQSEVKKGLQALDKNPNWKGGISFEPYCIKWTQDFRERVRKFFGNKCVLCGRTTKPKLCVHHINYDKSSCCTDVKPLFVPLCRACHTRTNFDRGYWEQHFTEMITNKYDGKCYIEKV